MELIVIALSIVVIISAVCIIRTFRSRKPISKEVLPLLVVILVPIFANLLIAATDDPMVADYAFLLYFVSTNWVIYFLIRFSAIYCDFPFHRSPLQWFWLAVMTVDSLIVLLNPYFHHVFGLMIREQIGRFDQFYVESHWYHFVHLAISALGYCCIFSMYFSKLRHTSELYREKYLVIIISLIVTSAWQVGCIVFRTGLDRSMVGYGLLGVLIYIFAVEYPPIFLKYQMMQRVLGGITDGIFFFNEKYDCIYYNPKAAALFDLEPEQYTKAYEVVGTFLNPGETVATDYIEKNIEYTLDGELKKYSVEYQKIYDKKKLQAGFYVVIRDHTEEERIRAREHYDATHDALTGLLNRDEFYRLVQEKLTKHPADTYLALGSNIKEFKLVNDIFGHTMGDKVLIKLARIIEGVSKDGDLVARIDNDRFAVFIRKSNFDPEIMAGALSAVDHIGDIQYPLVIHIGINEVKGSTDLAPSVIFDRAFMAITAIKNDNQKRAAYYDDSFRDSLLWEQKLTGSLDQGIQNGEIIPYLQAQVDSDGVMRGAEVLVRWIHPTEGFLPPGKFIGLFEKNGLIAKVDRHMWESACRILKKWKDAGRDDLYLSVNISAKDFYFLDVYAEITGLVAQYELDPKSLRLEITESVMVNDSKRKLDTIEQLRNAGFILEIDDFGSGYSSLNLLKDMPVDILKLDMLFLSRSYDNEEKQKIIIDVMINMASRLGIPVISEGVETLDQVLFLKKLGCEMFQGYYFARPVSLEAFEEQFRIFENTGK
ncbi:MAG: EAL domain-containing protein [Lachnospiraceae bacterium]|nr:EAL domain-containing protein [Lachnospiraceae bacterium]